jgi:hypothetical protein
MKKYSHYINWGIVAVLFGIIYFMGKIRLFQRNFEIFLFLLFLVIFLALLGLLKFRPREK